MKADLEGEALLSRTKYRKGLLTGTKPLIAKGEYFKAELSLANNVEERNKNPDFGFKCLHYSVSESSESLQIAVYNKNKKTCMVRVKTIDAEAKAGEDFDALDTVVNFSAGDDVKYVKVIIHDDDSWEPDEDFFVQLFDAQTDEVLDGADTRTRVTIIDDDKPGQVCFAESTNIKALATDKEAVVKLVRKNGSDGIVTVDYETFELDVSKHSATAGTDFKAARGTLSFENTMTEASFNITIIDRPELETRDETFGIKLSNVTPAGAKLSKKNFHYIDIVTDLSSKKQ